MRHLSHDELLAAVERPSRDEHLAACASCRAEVETLAAILHDVASTAVPEPSPLFWDHFSVRVREACSRDARDPRVGADQKVGTQKWRPWRVAAPAMAALVLLLAAGRFFEWQPATPAPAPAPPTTAAVVPAVPPADDPVPADESWGAFAAVASEADPGGTAFAPSLGLADGAVLQMSDEERGELIRLLERELARGNARSRG